MFKCRLRESYREEKDEGTAERGLWTIKVPVTLGGNGSRVWVERLASCRRPPALLEQEGGGGGPSQVGLVWIVEPFHVRTSSYSLTYKRLEVGQGEMRDLKRVEA